MYQCLPGNARTWQPDKDAPKLCESAGCNQPATLVGVAQNANWYLCDKCGKDVVTIIRLTLRPPDRAGGPVRGQPSPSARPAGDTIR